MTKFMLDTNICIYLIKQKPLKVLEHLKSHNIGEIGISSITLAELQYGVAKSLYKQQNKIALDEFSLPLEVFPFHEKVAEIYGTIRAQLEQAGEPIGSLDTLIGAHALSLGIAIVTNNLKEFKRIKKLKVVDWTV